MAESLNVIALISGGKDSFFSVLHCLQNGHKVVALGNLYPASPTPRPATGIVSGHGEPNVGEEEEDEHDLNSFMYQTVGHTVIPLYEKALGIPLYRQPIVGTAVQTGTTYSHADAAATVGNPSSDPLGDEAGSRDEVRDETESLTALLERVLAEHPTANALSTGAILSTYQRTRVESVALRLGLTPLSYLWKYPVLPPGTPISLLQDMHAVGLDARIVKVASGGLDESFLWENVASEATMRRIERSVKRFGTDDDGAVLGEGGEFETLVVDGPSNLFKWRIEIEEKDRRIVREGGGSAWLRILHAKLVMKTPESPPRRDCRVPELLESRFKDLLRDLYIDNKSENPLSSRDSSSRSVSMSMRKESNLQEADVTQDDTIYWTISSPSTGPLTTISAEAERIITIIRRRLKDYSFQPSNITSSLITLRSMQDFAAVNKVYGSLFTQPNPPARVTISCGPEMPKDVNLTIHLKIHAHPVSPQSRRALHVQSRSYWAPANIGPYSQAISTSLSPPSAQHNSHALWTVDVAGQIALVPSSMGLPRISTDDDDGDSNDGRSEHETPPPLLHQKNFNLQTALSLQHLWRIGREMHVAWWASAVAYLPRGSDAAETQVRARVAGRAWARIHARDEDEDADESDDAEVRDPWEEKLYAGRENLGGVPVKINLPDWEAVEVHEGARIPCPPLFIVEVEELPRGSAVEWHAHLGLVSGKVQLESTGEEDRWIIHQCVFASKTHLVVAVYHSPHLAELKSRLTAALDAGSISHNRVYLSYLDASMADGEAVRELKGIIPCRSIWDISGKRLSAVLILELTQLAL